MQGGKALGLGVAAGCLRNVTLRFAFGGAVELPAPDLGVGARDLNAFILAAVDCAGALLAASGKGGRLSTSEVMSLENRTFRALQEAPDGDSRVFFELLARPFLPAICHILGWPPGIVAAGGSGRRSEIEERGRLTFILE